MKRESQRIKKANLRMVFNVLIVVALVVVVVVLAIMNNRGGYNDDYFVTDANKVVVTMDKDVASYENSEYEPPITRMVYYLSGDKVSEMRLFFEYDDEEDAKIAFNNISMNNKQWAATKTLEGRFIVFRLNSDQYENMTAEQARMFAN